MKKLMTIMIVLASVTLTAQRGPRNGNDGMHKDLTAQETATLQTKKMTLALALDNNQSLKVYDVLLVESQERKAKRAERAERDASKEKAAPTKEERYAKAIERLDHQIAMQDKMKNILTDEQFIRYKRMKMKRKSSNKHKNKGGKRSRM